MPAKTKSPTRDQTLDDLDERSDRLNGHTSEGRVRPSEQCRAPSPRGIGCTFKLEHPGLHSWTPEPVHNAEADGEPEHVLHDFAPSRSNHTLCDVCSTTLGKSWHLNSGLAQPTLPGTPEPE